MCCCMLSFVTFCRDKLECLLADGRLSLVLEHDNGVSVFLLVWFLKSLYDRKLTQ